MARSLRKVFDHCFGTQCKKLTFLSLRASIVSVTNCRPHLHLHVRLISTLSFSFPLSFHFHQFMFPSSSSFFNCFMISSSLFIKVFYLWYFHSFLFNVILSYKLFYFSIQIWRAWWRNKLRILTKTSQYYLLGTSKRDKLLYSHILR